MSHFSQELTKAKNAGSGLARTQLGVANRISDKELYKRLIQYGETEHASRVLESARRLDQLQAVDRQWMYQDQEESTKVSKKLDDGGGKRSPPGLTLDTLGEPK